MALSLGQGQQKKPSMHTEGLVGEFLVQVAEGGKEKDKFSHALDNLSQRLASPNAILLDRPIISPQEWISDPYYS